MTTEPHAARAAATRPGTSRAELAALGERVARVEATAEHLRDTLLRIDASLAKVQQKIDTLAGTMAQGIGGLRVGALVGQAAAAVAGFLAAHFWPAGK